MPISTSQLFIYEFTAVPTAATFATFENIQG